MIKPVQWALEDGYETECEALAVRHELAEKLIAELRSKGFSDFVPPEMPATMLQREHGINISDCRVLVRWIPDWLPSRWAGKFAVRVDTLVLR